MPFVWNIVWQTPVVAVALLVGMFGASRAGWSGAEGIVNYPFSGPFQPYIGFDFVIVMYAGVVLGGLGSILGASWGGHLIGIVRSARPTWLELERAGRSLSRRQTEVGFAPDSVLEGEGFEPSVPSENAFRDCRV
jgi:branched-subunit amino acid ABC-type transport system permease component